jgi:hypothetical protein
MKYVILLIILAALAAWGYKAYVGGSGAAGRLQQIKQAEAQGPVSRSIKSGQRVGEGAGKAFEGVNFGGRR